MKKLLIYWILFVIFVLSPIVWYTYNKTLWKDNTDCMINYINKYYPNWYTYYNYWYYHIDKPWLDYWENLWPVDWCVFKTDNYRYNINNTTYCYYTLFFETILWKTNDLL